MPHLVVIIKKLDELVRAEYQDPSVQIIDKQKTCIWRTWIFTFQIQSMVWRHYIRRF